MNVTLAIDDHLLERARELAARRGTSLNQMVRQLLAHETGLHGGDEQLRELETLWETTSGRSGGARFRREDTYAERMR